MCLLAPGACGVTSQLVRTKHTPTTVGSDSTSALPLVWSEVEVSVSDSAGLKKQCNHL